MIISVAVSLLVEGANAAVIKWYIISFPRSRCSGVADTRNAH